MSLHQTRRLQFIWFHWLCMHQWVSNSSSGWLEKHSSPFWPVGVSSDSHSIPDPVSWMMPLRLNCDPVEGNQSLTDPPFVAESGSSERERRGWLSGYQKTANPCCCLRGGCGRHNPFFTPAGFECLKFILIKSGNDHQLNAKSDHWFVSSNGNSGGKPAVILRSWPFPKIY